MSQIHDLSTLPNHKEVSSRGGRANTPKQRLTRQLNGLSNLRDITPLQLELIKLVKNDEFVQAIKLLIAENLKQIDDPKRRDIVIGQLQKLLPERVLALHANLDQNLDFSKAYEEYLISEGVCNVCHIKHDSDCSIKQSALRQEVNETISEVKDVVVPEIMSNVEPDLNVVIVPKEEPIMNSVSACEFCSHNHHKGACLKFLGLNEKGASYCQCTGVSKVRFLMS